LLAGVFMQQLYPERARVVLHTPWGAPTMLCADAAYRGTRTNADGMKEVLFEATEKIEGLTADSCLRLSVVEKLEHGQKIALTCAAENVPAGVTRIEPRSFMALATDLCRIIWPFILLASVSALCMGALNVFGVFGLPNLASAAFNLTTVGVGALIGWYIDPSFGPDALYGFAVAVVCGGAAQVLVQLPKLRQKGYRAHWDIGLRWTGKWFSFTDPAARRVWMLMLPGVIAAGITQTNIFINTAFALYLQPGSVTALSSAFHLWQLPVALFGVAVGMVVLPTVSRMTLTGGDAGKEISAHLAKALRFMALFAIPSAIFLCIWGDEIVSVFYQRGRFDAAAACFTGDVLAAYSLGLLAYAGMKVLQPVFLALEKPWAPAGLALVAFCISVGCNYTFVHVFNLPATYLALTTSIVTTLNFLFYFLYIRHLLGGMALHILMPGLLRIMGAGVVLALVCWGAGHFVFGDFTSWSFLGRFGALAVGGTVCGALYIGACLFFRVPELQAVTGRFLRR
ncbi:MAG: polysaccharide biosynthesis C-terminal domain-containing protein, partial [Akkermansia sp.]|nr:polysaccharide biosynthesis C-terminal domain-containing protein [Akkermansia sp.]